MKDYLERILHQDVDIVPYRDRWKLPLVIRDSYDLKQMTINGREALAAAPVEKIPLTILRKHQHQMEVYTGLPCVLFVKNLNYYSRDAMVKEGIPFVWEGHQIYLPFIGILLDDHPMRTIVNCSRISFLTQKMLIMALYRQWQRVTVSKAAELLDVSKMSATRCFDEMEAINLPYLTMQNRARSFTADRNKKAMWETLYPSLRTPVIESYALKEKPDRRLPLAGTSALASYSMLGEGEYPILAITKREFHSLNLSTNKLVPAGEFPKCVVQKTGYWIPFAEGKAIDPLSTVLSLDEDERADPRVSMAIDEMLEKYVW